VSEIRKQIITPEMAEQMLERRATNRHVSHGHVEVLARQMTLGTWLVDASPPLLMDGHGRLLDGQHRLSAIVTSGIPTEMWVHLGVVPEVQHAVDTGRKRTAGDVLSINGIDNSAQIASGARLAMAYGAGRLGENAGYRVTPAEVLAWYGENPSIADGIAASRRLNRDHGVPMSVGTCLHYLFSQASTPSHADEFFDLLSMRVGLPQGSAILALDRALSLEVRTRSVRVAPLRYLALLIKGWNAWLDGRSVQLLRWTAVEDFPEIKRPKFDTVVS
jgi:hypothetical protein